MFCPSCGKSIPDESNFCLYCGSATDEAQSKKSAIVPSDEMPVYIKDLSYWENDIRDNKGRFGFGVSFMLLDKELRPTRYDGELEIKVEGRSSWRPKFQRTIQARKEDFRVSRIDPNWYGYVFEHAEPIIPYDFSARYVSIQFLPKGKKERLTASTF